MEGNYVQYFQQAFAVSWNWGAFLENSRRKQETSFFYLRGIRTYQQHCKTFFCVQNVGKLQPRQFPDLQRNISLHAVLCPVENMRFISPFFANQLFSGAKGLFSLESPSSVVFPFFIPADFLQSIETFRNEQKSQSENPSMLTKLRV